MLIMELPPAAALWALHHRMLELLVRRQEQQNIMPGLIRGATEAFAGQSASSRSQRVTLHGSTLIIGIWGVLAPAGVVSGRTSYDAIEDDVRNAASDSRVQTIILDVRSPGGTVWGCAEAADAIYAARAIKPVIAVASPYSFSAAHWLATQAGNYFAAPSGEVGAVGVRTAHTDMSSFERKIGMRTTLIASSSEKIAANSYAPLSDEDQAELQAKVNEQGKMFVLAIARGRALRPRDVDRIHGTGAVMSARRAYIAGAIDGVATLRELVERASSSQNRAALMRRQAAAAAALSRLLD